VPTTTWTQGGRAPRGPGGAAAGTRGPRARTGRDLGVLAVVVVVLGALVHVGTSRQYPVPVSLGNATIANARPMMADADHRFGELVNAEATRVAQGARCYFWRPLGPTQGAMPAGAFPAGLLPGDEKPDAVDIILCGPVEISPDAAPLGVSKGAPPWVSGIVYYTFSDKAGSSIRGKVKMMLAIPLPVLAATGGARADTLLTADGHHPGAGSIAHPRWRHVTPTGEVPPGVTGLPGGGTGLPGGGTGLPPGVTVPPGITVPPGVSVPTLPPVTLPPGMTLPPGVSVPTLPGGGG